MSMEPLENLLIIYEDKGKVLRHYLPEETTKKLISYEFVQNLDTIFLNDRLFLISKQTGKLYKKGNVIKITDENITIKTSIGNISSKKSDYYLFRLPRKNKLQRTNKKFYEELLKSLN
jgi:hypothetical protein